MDARHAKAPFELMPGAGQPLDIIALKQTPSEIGGRVTNMVNCLPERPPFGFLFLHLSNEGQVALAHLRPSLLLLIRQDVSCLLDEIIGALQWRPEAGGRLESFHKQLHQLLHG
jgi:hypothetical protein